VRVFNRVILLLTALLAGYQVVVMDGLSPLALVSFTLAFGVLLVASILLMILGFEALESSAVVVVAAVIPLSTSLGLAAAYNPAWAVGVFVFSLLGLFTITLTRRMASRRIAALSLAVVHGVSGLLIFGLPIILAMTGIGRVGILFISLGGAMFGLGGVLLTFIRTGRPLLSQQQVYSVLPVIMLLTTGCFVLGLRLA